MKKLKPGEEITLSPQEISEEVALLSPTSKQLQLIATRRHPAYERLLAHWKFLASTYEGGREWFGTNIHRYHKEGQGEFGKRLERAYRFNHTKEVVDLLNKYLFKQEPTRNEDAPAATKKFWQRATRSGLSMTEFMREVSKQTSINGRIGIVVDRPATGAVSVAELSKAENQPYAYIVGPKNLLDYSFSEDGSLNWVLVMETVRDDKNPLSSSGDVRERYRLWTRQEWLLISAKDAKKKAWVIEDQGSHGLGEVPVILADHIVSDEAYETQSLIDDIAYLDRAVANYLSNLDAIIQDQTFSQLAMPAQNVLPGEEGYNKLIEVGSNRIFLYDGSGEGKPFFLSPDPKQAELIISVIHKIINEIYHTVGLAGERTKEDNALGIDNSSGVAKAFDFERVNALLSSKGDSLESIENKVARLVALWNGESVADWNDIVEYPESYDVRNLYDEFDIAGKLALVSAPDTMRREQMRALADKMFPQLAKDLKEKIKSELESWPIDPIEQLRLETEASTPPAPAGGSRQGQVTKTTPGAPNNNK